MDGEDDGSSQDIQSCCRVAQVEEDSKSSMRYLKSPSFIFPSLAAPSDMVGVCLISGLIMWPHTSPYRHQRISQPLGVSTPGLTGLWFGVPSHSNYKAFQIYRLDISPANCR